MFLKSNLKLLSAEELTHHVGACALNSRQSQKAIYCSFYGYAMAICGRYANDQEDALEILNDGFLKVFREIHHYKPAYTDVVSSFKGWIRKIMIYTAIDHFRKNCKHKIVSQLDDVIYQIPSAGEDAIEKISHEEIIRIIQKLSPGYRAVFNLYVIEGLGHDEIANRLGISSGTSKSNLSKARRRLQSFFLNINKTDKKRNAV